MKVFFLLFPFLVFSQQHVAKGVVLDKVTNEPIPYVNISILESRVGTSSDDDGSFSLEIKKEDINKVVRLSSLGYESSKITVSLFLKSEKIFLKPRTEVLEEVIITNKFEEKTNVINKIEDSDLCYGYGSLAESPWIMALYFPYNKDYKETEFLKSVKFHFGNFKNKKAKFRLRLFTIGKDSLPDKDILKENVIVELKKKQKEAVVDISDYDILFPREGFYVAFEWLYIPYNAEEVTFYFTDKKKKKEKRIKYQPTFSATCEDEGKYMVASYISGEWRFYAAKAYKSEKKAVPAISLTLSN
ncbi:MAG: hypothetical protein CMC05_13005 [Flavobacteriaceae bacterium]|nr:hypothetical protein [Flavobacteriaceae bacterium]|tara:strand:+ start:2446 stop:3348 length:903 start_codon:yes stop_codon:yes gene_type:complete